jgi:membrane protease YdiL (CAAX protease family)
MHDSVIAAAIVVLLLSRARASVRDGDPWVRGLSFFVFLALSVGMFLHAIPVFHNYLYYDHVKFAEDSVPFTMYLNFDKTIAGLAILWFFVLPFQSRWQARHLKTAALSLAAAVLVMLPLSFALGYVRFDPKFPDGAWVWMANNLFLVCMSEEALFRGLIQGGLQRKFPKVDPRIFIGGAALLFGAAHYPGGILYVLLASIAGLFYGFTYWKTGRIELAMVVHFGTNLLHFLLFSYPALV